MRSRSGPRALSELTDQGNQFTGGGIVYDSDPYEEYIETINKLMANMQCIQTAEEIYARQQKQQQESPKGKSGP